MSHFNAWIVIAAAWMSCAACSRQAAFEDAVKVAVNRQMATYPQSTLKDLYKNFFQDRFGPGHLIGDTVASGNYLRRELASFDRISGAYYEPTGWEGRYYRVNLSVLKENLVSYNVYFDAFVRSVNEIKPPTVKEWEKEWVDIDAVIKEMNLTLPNYEVDRQEIFNLLKEGAYVMHHSKQFEDHYTPHYRIMEKTIFENEIKPFLPEK
jgi:hypothetical protein